MDGLRRDFPSFFPRSIISLGVPRIGQASVRNYAAGVEKDTPSSIQPS